MTLSEAGEIFAYWQQNPPPHLLLQTIGRLLGWAPSPTPEPLAALAAAPPPGLGLARGADLGMPPPLHLDELRRRNLDIARRHQAREPG